MHLFELCKISKIKKIFIFAFYSTIFQLPIFNGVEILILI